MRSRSARLCGARPGAVASGAGHSRGGQMRRRRYAWHAAIGIVILAAASGAPAQTAVSDWVAEIVWVPQYCRDHANERIGDACVGQPGFALRRLRPMQQGACMSRSLSDADTDNATRVIASARWAQDMWRRDGACSGLRPAEYFDFAGRLGRRLDMSSLASLAGSAGSVDRSVFEREILRDQNSPDSSSLVLRCDGTALTQIEVCVNAELDPVACERVKPRTLCRGAIELRGNSH